MTEMSNSKPNQRFNVLVAVRYLKLLLALKFIMSLTNAVGVDELQGVSIDHDHDSHIILDQARESR